MASAKGLQNAHKYYKSDHLSTHLYITLEFWRVRFQETQKIV